MKDVVAVKQQELLFQFTAHHPQRDQIVGVAVKGVVAEFHPERPLAGPQGLADLTAAKAADQDHLPDAGGLQNNKLPLENRTTAHGQEAFRLKRSERPQSAALTSRQDYRFHHIRARETSVGTGDKKGRHYFTHRQ